MPTQRWTSPRRRKASIRRDRRATTTVEFAIVAPAMVALLFCLVEFAWQLTIETALNIGGVVGARFGSTGNNNGGSQSQAILNTVVAASGGLMDPTQLTIADQSYTNAGSYASGGTATSGAGTSAQFVVYTLTYKQTFLTGLPARLFGLSSITHQATVAVQNEPY